MSQSRIITPVPQRSEHNEVVVLALGDFWRAQKVYDGTKGVVDTVVGYAGGREENPTHDDVSDHTECVLVEYDPSATTFREILEPVLRSTRVDRRSRRYRTAVFHTDADQHRVLHEAMEEMKRVRAEELGERRVHLDVEPAALFYRAEDFHQKFMEREVV